VTAARRNVPTDAFYARVQRVLSNVMVSAPSQGRREPAERWIAGELRLPGNYDEES